MLKPECRELNHLSESIYKSSTFFRAQGVFLKNTKLDLMLGSKLKQLILIILPKSSHP